MSCDDEAIAAARATLRIQPNAPVAWDGLCSALFMKGMFEEALALNSESIGGDRELLEALEQGYSEAGYSDAQNRIAEVMARRYWESGRPSAFEVALTYLYAGERGQTLEWLERAYQAGDGNMPCLGLPIYDSMRADPRFQDLLRRMNLPQ